MWLKDVLAALATLYAAALSLRGYGLPEDAIEPPESLDVSDEECAGICNRVGEILGERNFYWTYFDPTIENDPTEKPVAGALWDDLGDIYRDVKPGLKAWDTGRASIFTASPLIGAGRYLRPTGVIMPWMPYEHFTHLFSCTALKTDKPQRSEY